MCIVFTSPAPDPFPRTSPRRRAGEISEADLLAVLEECETVNAGRPITFFEITTAAAFLAFARTPADITLLETGLGGRLDATNTVRKPLLTVITPVSLDHQHFLGDTIEEIAGEKAGIMKKGVPCLMAAQSRKAGRVLTAHARELSVPLRVEGADWYVLGRRDGLTYAAGERTHALPMPSLAGKHQHRNAGLAVACAENLPGFSISDAALARGLETAKWPARLQHLDHRVPLAAQLPDGWELWLDGGHNPGAGKVLAEHCRKWRDKPLYLVVGMMSGKDAIGFLKPMEAMVAGFRGVAIPGEANGLPAEKTALAAGMLGISTPSRPTSVERRHPGISPKKVGARGEFSFAVPYISPGTY